MINKYIIAFCEGDHDIAFLSKILFSNDFSPYDEKIKDYNEPFNKFFENKLKNNYEFEDHKFKFQRPKNDIPYTVLKKENSIAFFHNLDGDGNILNNKCEDIITSYLELTDKEIVSINNCEIPNFRFLYFLDADEKGVNERLESLKKILSIEELEIGKIYKVNNYEIGVYIFYDPSSTMKHGKLENMIYTMMKENNQIIFDNSSMYIKQNILDTFRQKKYDCNKAEHKGDCQFKEEKSIISVAGQLQFSGSSNAVIITHSDYIKKEDVKSNEQCQKILGLFE